MVHYIISTNNFDISSLPHHVHKELFDVVKKEMSQLEFRNNLSERMWKL